MEETTLDVKNVEENKKQAIAKRLGIKVEDVPQELLNNDELKDLLIFGGEVKESYADSLKKIKHLTESRESFYTVLIAAGFKKEEAEKLYELC